MELFSLAFAFFLIANPIGNVPVVVGLIKNFSFEKQKKIMMRECFFAFLLAVIFQFAGTEFLSLIEIRQYTVSIAGGILLFIVALNQIFPIVSSLDSQKLEKEPFLVPIATPLITGGGLMSTIMLYSKLVSSPLIVTGALALAFCLIAPIMMGAPYLQRLLGRQGILTLEQLMGMILSFLSMELIVNGAILFTETV